MAYLWRYKKQEDSEKERVERAAERFRKQYPDAYSRADYALSHMAPGETSFRNPDGTMTSFHPARSNRSSFFPNVGGYSGTTGKSYMQPLGLSTGYGAPGMAEGQARMDQIANTSTYKSRRAAGSMVVPQSGQGSMWVPSGNLQSYLDKGYTNYAPPRTAAQQFDINQARTAGKYSGIPLTSTQQIGGGQYNVRETPYGGVASPTPQAPNFFQRQFSNLYSGLTTAFPAIAQGLFGGRGGAGQYAGQQGGGLNQPSPNQNFYAYNPSPVPNQPRRYFDF